MGDVEPIIQSKCVTCHAPGGLEAKTPLLDYQQVKAAADFQMMYLQVVTCRMPRAPSAPLPPDERQILLAWLFCGAPNN